MIAKTTVGSSFEGALTYGAGHRPGRRSTEAELLGSSNVREGTPQEMAKQMEEVANESTRIQKAVWHTSLSWPPGEMVSREQKLAAAEMYCELMGAPFDRHQVVVYEHHDKPHEHIHIYINRVPIDGGPALRTSNNFYKQPKVCKEICRKLGMQQLPDRKQRAQSKAVSSTDPSKQAVRTEVRAALTEILAQPSIAGQNINWLTRELHERKISVKYTHDKQGILRGVSFSKGELAMTGQEVGYKAAHLLAAFEAAATKQVQRQAETSTIAPTGTPAPAASPAAAPPQPAIVPPPVRPADENPDEPTRKVPRRRI